MERKDELEAQVRKTSLRERLDECRTRIGKMCSEGRPPRMCIPVQWDDDDFYISTTLADAQRALDAAQARVKELELYLTQERANRDSLAACVDRDVKKIKELQAQLADRDAMILQMGKQAARLAKDGIAAKAQLRQVEGERDAHAQDVDDLIDCCINDVLVTHATPGGKPHDPDPQIRPLRDKIAGSLVELQTLRQLVEALPVVDGRMDVECGACYYIRSFIAGQYGVVCGLIIEQSTAMAIKALLEYRATQAAQDAGAKLLAWVNEAMRLAPTQTNPPHPTEEQS